MQANRVNLLLMVAAMMLVLSTLMASVSGKRTPDECKSIRETSDYSGDAYVCKACCKRNGFKMSSMGDKCSCLLGWG